MEYLILVFWYLKQQSSLFKLTVCSFFMCFHCVHSLSETNVRKKYFLSFYKCLWIYFWGEVQLLTQHISVIQNQCHFNVLSQILCFFNWTHFNTRVKLWFCLYIFLNVQHKIKLYLNGTNSDLWGHSLSWGFSFCTTKLICLTAPILGRMIQALEKSLVTNDIF